jgi:hypothetical protein
MDGLKIYFMDFEKSRLIVTHTQLNAHSSKPSVFFTHPSPHAVSKKAQMKFVTDLVSSISKNVTQ